ncbi:MAG: KpsF/GutQ family protein [Gammaproteobacteria bacterium]|jgi:arabinose-5-phosphate isomerase|nr:KpsF/GutQ family protein [Gammaproteobacteria bacterium]
MEKNFLTTAKRVIDLECQSIQKLIDYIDDDFAWACETILACQGRVVVLGMGKSGHIAAKIAATLASTGTPAFCVHPGDASHGDLGMITPHDVVLAISNSGETPEILTLLPLLKELQVKLIAICGHNKSTLARFADALLNTHIDKEACPLGLAPTTSTTAALVMGDALAVAILDARGFTKEDFARSHPSGSLGRRLLMRVRDIMRTGDKIPRIHSSAMIKDALLEMTQKLLGMTAVIDNQGKLVGIYTDGDLRRTLNQGIAIHETPLHTVMTTTYKTITADLLATEALEIMENFKITSLLVVDEAATLIGALNIHDIMQAGL